MRIDLMSDVPFNSPAEVKAAITQLTEGENDGWTFQPYWGPSGGFVMVYDEAGDFVGKLGKA